MSDEALKNIKNLALLLKNSCFGMQKNIDDLNFYLNALAEEVPEVADSELFDEIASLVEELSAELKEIRDYLN